MIQRIFIRFTGSPGIMRIGVLILAVGGALDIFYHAAPVGWAIWLDGYLGRHAAGATQTVHGLRRAAVSST